MYFVAVDIGCIECGESSNVLGVFTSKSVADKVVRDHEKRQSHHWGGQHSFEVFEIDSIDRIYEVSYE
ncbi:hypothetical protein HYI36_20175 [Bacillus sp. Gen3]|nr:hypothetical protein [Bacillus sp. Gen3]